MSRYWWMLLMLSSAGALADDSGFDGIVAVASTGVERPYRGTRTDLSLAPLVLGRWRNVYFEGNRVTVGLHQGDGWSFAALGQLRLHQYADAGEVTGLDGERRRALELGAVVTVPAGAFTLQAAALHDVSGAHRGMEFELRGFTEWSQGMLTLVPSLSLQRQDDELAAYYFDAGATGNLLLETLAIIDLAGGWSLIGSVRHFRHGDAIAASPLVDRRATNTWAFAIGRRF